MAHRIVVASAVAILTLLAACGGSGAAPPPAALPPPQIASVDPGQVSTAGSAVVVHGSGFQSGAAVSIGGAATASATYLSATQLLVAAPAHAAGTVDVEVVNPDGQRATLAAGLAYAAPAAAPPPALSAVTPDTGTTAGGAPITLTGTGFHPLATATFAGLPAERLSGDSTSLTVRVPPHPAGAVDVAVQNPDLQTAVLTGAFTYAAPQSPAPLVQGVSPSSGQAAGGQTVTITGADFVSPEVSFGGAVVIPSAATATSLTVLSPAHLPGSVDVTVRNADGQAGTLAGGYAYTGSLPAPAILGLSPSSGPTAGGGLTVLTGSGFVTGSAVTFGGTGATIVPPVTATSISVVAPQHAAVGAVDVRVVNPDAQSVTLAGGYTYLGPPPVILALNVRGGPPAGGTQVLAVGSGFTPGVTVAVGGLDATKITIETPGVGLQAVSFFTPAHDEGFADVVVTNPDGQSATYSSFHYGPPPVVSGISCSGSGGCGAVRRDDRVTITGTGFAAAPGVRVAFSSIDRAQQAVATQISASATEIVVAAPKLDPGLYSVVVNNFDGQVGVAAQRLTYPGP